jgi:glutathione S-transferase
MSIQYIEPEAAHDLPGLRIALTKDAPAPYSMSARAILDLKNVPYTPVAQIGAGANEALVEWTRHRNGPVAVFDNEAPRVGWLEILNLAERLGSGPSLIPDDQADRMMMIGLVNELIGENGWVWNMRLLMLGLAGPERAASAAQKNPMFNQYGYSETAREKASDKAKAAMSMFTQHMTNQKAQGSNYIIGSSLSAADVYWAYFSLIMKTMPDADCPMPGGLRKSYDLSSEAIGGCDPVLIDQRDWIFANHLTLPMTF